MNRKRLRSGWGLIVVAICFLSWGLGCGDDELSGEDGESSGGAEENDRNQDEIPSEEDCEEGETFNPVTGECLASESEDQDNQNQGGVCDDVDCDDGLYCDPSSGDCVECIGDGHCEPGYVCSESSECIDETSVAEECTSDDDCGDEEQCNVESGECESDVEFECGPGAIVGETCTAADGPLPGAHVVVDGYDCEGVGFSMDTTAANDGSYEFEDVPAGTHELTISSGSFEITDTVSVQKGEVTDLKDVGQKLCFAGTEVDIAVATGGFDDIVSILDGMNIEYDTIVNNSSFFSDLDQMRQYDIIFAECGTSTMGLGGSGFDSDGDEIAYNIRRYVEEGYSLYASDWASRFVRYPIPEAIEFSDETGTGQQTVMADVESDLMQMVLESHEAEVHFNAGGWHMMESTGPDTEVQFRGDASTGSITLEEIPFMAIYDDPIGEGRAIYTSFHNNHQATGDMENILEFMIFQL